MNLARTRNTWLLGLSLVAASGCGTTAPAGSGVTFGRGLPTDTGGSIADSGGTDSGGEVDSGGGSTDAGPEDTGAPDVETPDTADVGTDAGPVDAGPKPAQPCSFDTSTGRTGKECPDDEVCIPNVGACNGAVNGTCKPVVQTCPTVVAEVCGCDGKTYGNACAAQKALVTVAADGPCTTGPQACGGNTGLACPAGEICNVGTCDLGGAGLCAPDPGLGPCPDGGQVECGCDDKTYPNVCYRLKAGVAKKQDGPCPEPPDATLCKIGPSGKPTSCPSGTYCRLNDGNPIECTGDGVCLNLPPVCDKSSQPVCGCNFTTFGNPCEAALQGINVKFGGSCDGSCTVGGNECGAGKYCAAPVGQCTGKGTCITQPATCDGSIDPVCGCDGKTHQNPGCAAAVGVVPKQKGACPN